MDVLLEHDLLRRRRADDPGQPAEMGRVPVRTPFVANVLAQQEGLQPHLVALEVADRVLAGAAQVADGFIVDRGYVDRAQRSEEHTSELQSRFDLVCRLLLEKKKE